MEIPDDKFDQKIFDAFRGTKKIEWTPEDFLELAAIASKRGHGFQFMGVTHFLKA